MSSKLKKKHIKPWRRRWSDSNLLSCLICCLTRKSNLQQQLLICLHLMLTEGIPHLLSSRLQTDSSGSSFFYIAVKVWRLIVPFHKVNAPERQPSPRRSQLLQRTPPPMFPPGGRWHVRWCVGAIACYISCLGSFLLPPQVFFIQCRYISGSSLLKCRRMIMRSLVGLLESM